MKSQFLFFLLFSIFLSCQNSTPNNDVVEAAEKPKGGESPIEIIAPFTADQSDNGYYEYKGSMDGDIPIEMHFNVVDGVIFGDLFYKKIGKPISIIGEVGANDMWTLSEFDQEGLITGIHYGNFKALKDLTWYSPATEKSRTMDLEMQAKGSDAPDYKPDDLVGVYKYVFSENGAVGTLNVNEVKGDQVSFDLICLTRAPARNIASVEEAEMTVKDYVIEYREKEGEYLDCAFDIKFFKDFAQVKYVDERHECEFGHNAYVEGIFKKIK